MGRIRELKEELEQLPFNDPRIPILRKKINEMEQWCIENKPEWGVTLTKWTDCGVGNNEDYPWNTGYVYIGDIEMVGSLNGTGINYNSDGSVHVSPNT